ncbi:MAG: ABC-type antimicrobial peptide transport system, ATPase component [Herbinix sp.]|jgi:putative ABC transport system ATP-binding protein|nr:ABC-type antimicrobial peptide transport system, ATPase component [Herbinix sp.]
MLPRQQIGGRMKQSILSADNVCKSFATNGVQNHVLNNVKMKIYEKDFTVIMGISGSGKSTLLYGLSGMDTITSGEVTYQERCITRLNENQLTELRREDFGFIFQQIHLVSNLSLLENVTVPGYLVKKKSSVEVKKYALELLERMNLSDAVNRLPSQVSGGEQQRAAIARAIINMPQILFADEPTGALNRKNTTDVLDLLSQLHENGQTILMVTHDIHAALRADRILYLADGSILGELSLPPYHFEDLRSREAQINAWLTSMEW